MEDKYLKELELLRNENARLKGIISALMPGYSSICEVDLVTEEVVFYLLSERMEKLFGMMDMLPRMSELAGSYVKLAVYKDDVRKLENALDPEVMTERLKRTNSYSEVFRNNNGAYGEMKVVRINDTSALLGFTEKNEDIIELNKQLYTDPLTLIYNRKYYDDKMTYQKFQAVVMSDIDLFKSINETYGHQCGDSVLATVAEMLRSCVRGSDTVVRFGGDEFLICFSEINENTLMRRLDEMRMKAASLRFGKCPSLFLSMSFGAVFGNGALPDMVRSADSALDESKMIRNAVTILPFINGM